MGKLRQGADEKGVFRPEGRLTFVPKPRTVVANCPVLAGGVFSSDPSWPDLVTAAGYLAARWSLHPRIWETLCVHLGREWATLTLATVAELPDSHFTLSRAPTCELHRAG